LAFAGTAFVAAAAVATKMARSSYSSFELSYLDSALSFQYLWMGLEKLPIDLIHYYYYY
jgi:hypothetical protein